ncbi:tripartite tricarboxylate transporter substrate binding protein [Roseomonas alkaliterrae]|uniref:Tripartite-type tricarboxylate transporter receptor subunit TctC n=1 Tax=Neoroseomonas alkaliterrae TaxID=1452450 RepID=A0A840XNZ9_9PROT|nr:tripartite tricarboxylate transporter substrate binding protein [Neoroseomonas alkaliterrae]MBB5690308.1 tripartite-type tricarboxylate transporter receptor subunit TctC [Neoroseomonas alkaliterrae]MBR0675893.1 tripartite tricarboxylate transporter substrate binding protein [Neoroseomonas alkaliterrae]
MPFTASRRALLAAAPLLALPGRLRAQGGWKPSRPVTLIVPFAAGSGTDTVSRLLASLLEADWGIQTVVENRPGANGAIAAVAAARAAPDGHTLMITTNSPHGATPALMRRPTYDAIADFTAICRMGTYIFTFVVNDQVPVRTMQEFLALAKARPGQLTCASGNTTGVVGAAMLNRIGGVDVTHVPYRSSPPAMTDLIAGRITSMFADVASSRAFLNEGKMKPLGITSARRTPLFPDWPALSEVGLPGFELLSFMGAVGPARMPEEAVAAWNAAIRKVWDRDETAARLGTFGIERVTSTPQEFGAFIREQIRFWGEQARAAGIEPE